MSGYETDDTDHPVCPHCGCINQDWWEGLEPKNDGDEWECHCPNCLKDYLVVMCVIATFSSRVKGGE